MKNQITHHILMNQQSTLVEGKGEFSHLNLSFTACLKLLCLHISVCYPLSSEKTLINFVPFITHDLDIKKYFHKKKQKKVNCFLSNGKSEEEKNCFSHNWNIKRWKMRKWWIIDGGKKFLWLNKDEYEINFFRMAKSAREEKVSTLCARNFFIQRSRNFKFWIINRDVKSFLFPPLPWLDYFYECL